MLFVSPDFIHISFNRVVVVSNYTKTLDLLQDLCVHTGYTFCRLDGQTPTIQRQRLVDSFNSPYSQNFLFLLSSKAGGVGLNLVGASHLVLYDIDWNPANDIQVSLYSELCLQCIFKLTYLLLFKCACVASELSYIWARVKAVCSHQRALCAC